MTNDKAITMTCLDNDNDKIISMTYLDNESDRIITMHHLGTDHTSLPYGVTAHIRN